MTKRCAFLDALDKLLPHAKTETKKTNLGFKNAVLKILKHPFFDPKDKRSVPQDSEKDKWDPLIQKILEIKHHFLSNQEMNADYMAEFSKLVKVKPPITAGSLVDQYSNQLVFAVQNEVYNKTAKTMQPLPDTKNLLESLYTLFVGLPQSSSLVLTRQDMDSIMKKLTERPLGDIKQPQRQKICTIFNTTPDLYLLNTEMQQIIKLLGESLGDGGADEK